MSPSAHAIRFFIVLCIFVGVSEGHCAPAVPSSPEGRAQLNISSVPQNDPTPSIPPTTDFACPIDQRLVGQSCYQCEYNKLILYDITFDDWIAGTRNFNGSLPLSEIFKASSYPNSVSDKLAAIISAVAPSCRATYAQYNGVNVSNDEGVMNSGLDDCIYKAVMDKLTADISANLVRGDSSLSGDALLGEGFSYLVQVDE